MERLADASLFLISKKSNYCSSGSMAGRVFLSIKKFFLKTHFIKVYFAIFFLLRGTKLYFAVL